VVALHGDIDLLYSAHAREILLKATDEALAVVVDLSGVGMIDSSGVASLIEAYQTAKSLNTRFGLVAVGGTPLRVLQVARLEKIFPMYPTVADGVAAKA